MKRSLPVNGLALTLALLGWTDQEAGERIGVDRSVMQRWRTGSTRPQKRFHRVLERVFQLPIDDLLRTDVMDLMERAVISG